MARRLKLDILRLREAGKTYHEIRKELDCSLSAISYHCNGSAPGKQGIPEKEQIEMQLFYDKCKSTVQTAKAFGKSVSTILKYVTVRYARVILSPHEKRQKDVERAKDRRKRIKQQLVDYKGGACQRCGYSKCIRALEFHHRDPEAKQFCISFGTYGIEKFKEEVDKCDLVCSNCHRELEDELLK